jgi:hypothetical protein
MTQSPAATRSGVYASAGASRKLGGRGSAPSGWPPLQMTHTQLQRRRRRRRRGGPGSLGGCGALNEEPGNLRCKQQGMLHLSSPSFSPKTRHFPRSSSPRRQEVLAHGQLCAVAAVDQHSDTQLGGQPQLGAHLGAGRGVCRCRCWARQGRRQHATAAARLGLALALRPAEPRRRREQQSTHLGGRPPRAAHDEGHVLDRLGVGGGWAPAGSQQAWAEASEGLLSAPGPRPVASGPLPAG